VSWKKKKKKKKEKRGGAAVGRDLMGWELGVPERHARTHTHFLSFSLSYPSSPCIVHRDLRDGEACARKYGKDWDRYCALVPWRLVPFVY
jgi:hypothetical protein